MRRAQALRAPKGVPPNGHWATALLSPGALCSCHVVALAQAVASKRSERHLTQWELWDQGRLVSIFKSHRLPPTRDRLSSEQSPEATRGGTEGHVAASDLGSFLGQDPHSRDALHPWQLMGPSSPGHSPLTWLSPR